MDKNTCKWNCENCNRSGTIVDLMKEEINHEVYEVKIINPKKIRNSINYELRKLIERSGESTEKDKIVQIYNQFQIYIREVEKT